MLSTNNGVTPVYQFASFSSSPRLLHFISTRKGGVSVPPFNELNLAFHVGDNPADVSENRERFFDGIGIPLESVVACQQTHSRHVAVVTDSVRGQGAFSHATALKDTDALITNTPNVCIVVMVADCVPILLYDTNCDVIGIVHAGWRGTVSRVTANAVNEMVCIFGSRPQDIIAGIGPSIGPERYEVSQDVVSMVGASFSDIDLIREDQAGRVFFDLWSANRYQLLMAGVPSENIEISGICTYTNGDSFFSYRREKQTGRFMAGAMLVK
jgi:YfiH family protein